MKFIFRSSMFMLLTSIYLTPLPAQWVKTDTLINDYVYALAVSGTNLFAGTYHDGVFLSTNNGTSWTPVDSGLTNTTVMSLAVSGKNLLAGTDIGVFLSTNNGSTWKEVDSGLANSSAIAFAISGNNLFAVNGVGVFLSTNDGVSWAGAGLISGGVLSLAVSDTKLYIGTDGGVFLSTNNGKSWTVIYSSLSPTTEFSSLAVSGSNLFAGIFGGGVLLTTDEGKSWSGVDSGLTNKSVLSLATYGKNIFAGTFLGGAFLSTNNGKSWTDVNSGLTNTEVLSFTVSGMNLFAGTQAGVWRRPLTEMVTDVNNHQKSGPTRFSLEQNYPNPFNPTTNFRFSIPDEQFVSLKLYDMLGKEVSILLSGMLTPGSYSVQWNALDLASGTYFYRLQAGNFIQTKKLLLLK